MIIKLFNRNDFWAGIMMIGIGTAAILIARNYPFGSVASMGAGFFPSVLGFILILFGIYNIIVGLRNNEKIKGLGSVRALIMLPISIILFGILMKHAGLLPALVVLIVVSAAAGKGFKSLEVLMLTVALTGFSLVLFIWGLGLPIQLLKFKIF